MTGRRHASEAGLNAATCVQSGEQADEDYYDDEDEEDGTECIMNDVCVMTRSSMMKMHEAADDYCI